jgi:hypothetical protein
LNNALRAGADLKDAISVSMGVKTGALKEACASCHPGMGNLGVRDGVRMMNL